MESDTGPNFFISIPHSGEIVPDDVYWLGKLPEVVLMRDVDRFVDRLYQPVIDSCSIVAVGTDCHRYVIDQNRFETDFDCDAVQGADLPSGDHPRGLHWVVTTLAETLISEPMTQELHDQLVENYYEPFHEEIQKVAEDLKSKGVVYQLDAHSMPSLGTALHSDPGQERAEIVVSDYNGSSCSTEYRDLVMGAFQEVGFEVAYNSPYVGGGITRRYGRPSEGHHVLQVELNRKLYMDEATKEPLGDPFQKTSDQVCSAVKIIYNQIKAWT